jgi:5-formyltetrahydrofolate cyclo-ligase
MTRRSKQEVREEVWRKMSAAGVGRFPFPLKGRIPNFKGAEDAARRLAKLAVWQRAETIKANPDSPQRPVRQQALDAGKTVYMAVPRLRDEKPFIELDPAGIDDTRRASTIKGAFEIGRPVALDDMPHIDLIVAGSVAVNRAGARVGKGGGYSDLEFGLGREAGIIDTDTVIATTVHPLQVVDEELQRLEHDIPVDYVITPDEVIRTETEIPRPTGIYWERLPENKNESIPVLKRQLSTNG